MVISPAGCRSASSTAAPTTRSRLSCGVARGGGGVSNQTMAAPYQLMYVVHVDGRRTRLRGGRGGSGGAGSGTRDWGAGGRGRPGGPDHGAAAAAPRGGGDRGGEAGGHLTAAQGPAVPPAD